MSKTVAWTLHSRQVGGTREGLGDREAGRQREPRSGRGRIREGEMSNFDVQKRRVDKGVQAIEPPFGRET